MSGAQIVDVEPNIFGQAVAYQVLVLVFILAHVEHMPIWWKVLESSINNGFLCIGASMSERQHQNLLQQQYTVLLEKIGELEAVRQAASTKAHTFYLAMLRGCMVNCSHHAAATRRAWVIVDSNIPTAVVTRGRPPKPTTRRYERRATNQQITSPLDVK